jgi:hypothetical protein
MLSVSLLTAALLSATLTPAEVATAGNDIVLDFEKGMDGLTNRFDSQIFVDRVMTGVDGQSDFLSGFRQGVTKSLKPGDALLRGVQNGSTLTFRKAVTTDGSPAAQIRLLNKDGSFNIMELILTKNAVGTVKVVDVWNLLDGDRDSDRVHRMAVLAAADNNQGVLDKLMGKEQALVKNLPTLNAFTEAVKKQAWPDVVAAYKKMPPVLQDDGTIAKRYLVAIQQVDANEYRAAMGKYLGAHAADASASVMAIDYYFTGKDWDGVLKAIDVVEKRVGNDDGWLEVLRGNVQLSAGKRDEAKKHYVAATKREPLLRSGYDMMLQMSVDDKNHADTAKWLAAMETDAKLQLNDIAALPQFSAFVASKEGKAFLKKHPRPAK